MQCLIKFFTQKAVSTAAGWNRAVEKIFLPTSPSQKRQKQNVVKFSGVYKKTSQNYSKKFNPNKKNRPLLKKLSLVFLNLKTDCFVECGTTKLAQKCGILSKKTVTKYFGQIRDKILSEVCPSASMLLEFLVMRPKFQLVGNTKGKTPRCIPHIIHYT